LLFITYDQFAGIICEEDLYPGVSGLTVYKTGQDEDQTAVTYFSAPYLNPYLSRETLQGLIAVNPDVQMDFFTFFTFQTILLFEAIEKASKKSILRRDLSKIPTALSPPNWPERRFVDDLWENFEFVVGYDEFLKSQGNPPAW